MNKNIVRLVAVIILLSPWIYVSSRYKEVLAIVFAIVLLLATVDISKKKKLNTDTNTDNNSDGHIPATNHSSTENKRQNISTL